MSTLSTLALGITRQAAEDDTTESEESTETTVDVVCGNAGAFCEALYEWSENELLAEAVSFLLGVPSRSSSSQWEPSS